MESPLTVQRVGQKVRIPMLLSSSHSDQILSNNMFILGEDFTNLVISKATSRAFLQTFDCLMVSPIARFRA